MDYFEKISKMLNDIFLDHVKIKVLVFFVFIQKPISHILNYFKYYKVTIIYIE